MKKLILLLLFIPLVFSCSSDDDGETDPMKLTIVNDFDLWTITSVDLQGYDFQNLSIAGGSSQSFILSDGIPSGSMNIAVNFKYSCRNSDNLTEMVRVNFYPAETTTIRINPLPDNTVDAILQDCYLMEFIVN